MPAPYVLTTSPSPLGRAHRADARAAGDVGALWLLQLLSGGGGRGTTVDRRPTLHADGGGRPTELLPWVEAPPARPHHKWRVDEQLEVADSDGSGGGGARCPAQAAPFEAAAAARSGSSRVLEAVRGSTATFLDSATSSIVALVPDGNDAAAGTDDPPPKPTAACRWSACATEAWAMPPLPRVRCASPSTATCWTSTHVTWAGGSSARIQSCSTHGDLGVFHHWFDHRHRRRRAPLREGGVVRAPRARFAHYETWDLDSEIHQQAALTASSSRPTTATLAAWNIVLPTTPTARRRHPSPASRMIAGRSATARDARAAGKALLRRAAPPNADVLELPTAARARSSPPTAACSVAPLLEGLGAALHATDAPAVLAASTCGLSASMPSTRPRFQAACATRLGSRDSS